MEIDLSPRSASQPENLSSRKPFGIMKENWSKYGKSKIKDLIKDLARSLEGNANEGYVMRAIAGLEVDLNPEISRKDFLFVVQEVLNKLKLFTLSAAYMQDQFDQKFKKEQHIIVNYARSLLVINEACLIHRLVHDYFDEVESEWLRLELVEILCDAHQWKLAVEKFSRLTYSGNASKLKYKKIKSRIEASLLYDKKPDIEVFYINLDQDLLKRRELESHLSQTVENFTRVPGVLAKTLPSFARSKLHRSHLMTVQVGALGCLLAHISALEKIVESEAKVALVLEDDAYFYYKPSQHAVNAILANDFDLIYVNSRMMRRDQAWERPFNAEPIASRLSVLPDEQSGWGGDGYILTKAGAQMLLDNFSNDLGLGHFDGQLGSYGLIGADFTPENKAQKIGASFVSRFSKKSTHIRCGCLDFPLVSVKPYVGSSRVENS